MQAGKFGVYLFFCKKINVYTLYAFVLQEVTKCVLLQTLTDMQEYVDFEKVPRHLFIENTRCSPVEPAQKSTLKKEKLSAISMKRN